MINLCKHTNSTYLVDCLMAYNSPYRGIIIVLGLTMFGIWCYLLGCAIRDKLGV